MQLDLIFHRSSFPAVVSETKYVFTPSGKTLRTQKNRDKMNEQGLSWAMSCKARFIIIIVWIWIRQVIWLPTLYIMFIYMITFRATVTVIIVTPSSSWAMSWNAHAISEYIETCSQFSSLAKSETGGIAFSGLFCPNFYFYCRACIWQLAHSCGIGEF